MATETKPTHVERLEKLLARAKATVGLEPWWVCSIPTQIETIGNVLVRHADMGIAVNVWPGGNVAIRSEPLDLADIKQATEFSKVLSRAVAIAEIVGRFARMMK